MLIGDVTTLAEAIQFINDNPGISVNDLKQLSSQMSVDVPGSNVTLLYSGDLDPGATSGGILAFRVAEFIGANDAAVATIGQTDASKLLSSIEFDNALDAAVGGDTNAKLEILNGTTDVNGNRITPGLFDDISGRFVSEATGPVKTITPTAKTSGVFTQTEIKAILDNPSITEVDGVPKQKFVDAFDAAIWAV